MKFECAVTIGGLRCEEQEPGDATFLGALVFCREHQRAFEGLIESGQLLREVNAAKLNRMFHDPSTAQANRDA